MRAEEGRISSVAVRPDNPAQSPDIGLVGCSGDPVRGVRALRLLGLLGTEEENTPGPGLVVVLPDLDFPPAVSKSKKSGSPKLEALEPSAGKGGLEAGDTRGDVCIDSGILSLVSNTKKASPPSPSFIA